MYDFTVKPADEEDVEIKEIIMYPIRGFKGIKMQEVELSNSGIIGDRLWTIYSIDKQSQLSNNGHDEFFKYLDLAFVAGSKTKLRIWIKDDGSFPYLKQRDHILDIERDYTGCTWTKHKYQ